MTTDPHFKRSDNLTDKQHEQIDEHEAKRPYKAVYAIGTLQITSLVLDQEEFNALVHEFNGLFPQMTGEIIEVLIKAKHVPMIARGSKTEKFFTRYGIETDRMCIIVRGAGEEVINRTLANESTRN